ncbi:DnaJ family domain-containing protein [Paenibacillus sp. DMB20]|uniref:DnaJ family domain-containing protein n=1 Tax=Paenibacillus sp. DMB20 TaxID=1642570 RepID=UPI000627D0E7|nr:DnaJ family domain-containing protein [Paenibacillus sp. DMB20]KKO53356.1 molecular chaperone DnaJ [Paenibacillus sp. DMB20]
MSMFSRLAEQKIEEAVRNGEFDNLSYAGKKLNVDDLSHIPEDLRMSYRIMKNAGFVPEEVALRNECVRLFDLVNACGSEGEREKHRKLLNEKTLRLQMLMEQRGLGSSGAFLQYEERIKDRLL